MPREIKILIFACLCLIFGTAFFATLVDTRSVMSALVFTGQVALIMIGTILGLLLFVWIGSKIFRE